ncbi:MAG TPA: dihydroorotase family protein [Saprospiraceae bacterium]|nr:dihydroorotase family protein [Saprospiraceae bacterium]HMP22920.1 dihydroorotase family protein [Saprospiraceae bacterium]
MLDLIIKNVRVVRPNKTSVDLLDLGIQNGKFVKIAPDIPATEAKEVFEGRNLLAFPGLTDAHMHTGIYSPLEKDAISESRAAAMGGVTSSLNYMRTGQYYLNKTGPYAEFYPEVLAISKGKFYVDYAYHLAPIMYSHIDEIEMLIERHGVTSFKIFMFYGSHGLHGKSDSQNEFLMTPAGERYDIAHFEFIMRGIRQAMERFPEISDTISLSLHCETAEIMRAYTTLVEREGKLKGLRAYSASRPPHSEGLAIFIASYLANETDCVNINLLHLTSRKAVDAALLMEQAFPHINFRREVTIGHLMLDVDAPAAGYAKVNPPIRPREDVEYLWECLLDRKLDWVVSDHACCSDEFKLDKKDPNNIFMAKSGFGGTEYLLSALVSEGSKRGMSYNHMAELVCWNPAKRFGLRTKGDIALGYDADVVLVNPHESFVVRAAESESAQGYTPFEGMELGAKVKQTFLRGHLVYDNGNIIGEPQGRYLARPYGDA